MLSHARRVVTEIAARHGYTIAPNWQLRDQGMGRHLRWVFEKFEIDCVFDVGANLGQYARFLRNEVAFREIIVSVEPIAAHVAALRTAAASDPLWHIEGVALGATPGRLAINVAKAGDMSSFLKPDLLSEPSLAELSRPVAMEEVEVRVFDDLLASVRRQHTVRNVYLKLDTQGFDLEVLKGIRDATPIRALQSEMSVVPLYQGMPDYMTALRAFAERGFVPSAMYPVTVSPDARLVEFDCVMVASH